jgi:hypothetical protein
MGQKTNPIWGADRNKKIIEIRSPWEWKKDLEEALDRDRFKLNDDHGLSISFKRMILSTKSATF